MLDVYLLKDGRRVAEAQILTDYEKDRLYRGRVLDDDEVVVVVNIILEPCVDINVTTWFSYDIEHC